MVNLLHMALGILLFACFVSTVLLARESAHYANGVRRARAERFTTGGSSSAGGEEDGALPVDEQMAVVPIEQVPASELESYAFPDIESAFGALGERLESMEENAIKFIEARDILNVVDKDSVRFAATGS